MSFRGGGGRGGGGFRGGRGGDRGGGRGGGGFRGGRGGGGRGGFGGGGGYDEPPQSVIEFGVLTHPCENDLVLKSNLEKVPYFNAPIYLENKEPIGKVDEIFGPIRDYSVSVKLALPGAAEEVQPEEVGGADPARGGDRGRGRAGFGDRGGFRGRGGFAPRGGGDRGRGGFGDRGGFRGAPRGDRGGFGGGGRFNGGGDRGGPPNKRFKAD
ncbi:putative H/ACA ribonucleoprotein complex subunit 1 [Hypsibius exemplaris]|uniref:H/ACA ribonucleoprotein complex subunit n=1 Tax=Hypsibius exemplaris TaxID=2072580 RepID=A0A1W0WWA1_HYPEX|nr:putative H/ACA ribonucleoprotein complex subunit 1 [Hypsibius exemplaris]